MIYLFYGPDSFARRQAVTALKAGIPADVADLNLAVLDGRGLKLPVPCSTTAAW
jgi:DNA polymerase III subunit delta